MLQSMAAAAERVFRMLDEEEEEQTAGVHASREVVRDGQTVTEPVRIEDVEASVTFDHVRFGYTEDKIIINDFSADIRSGKKIAIVGPTGAGKTTIVKLLMRFYDLNGGSISIGGYDVGVLRPQRAARDVRHGAAGHLAVLRYDYGKHPLRPSGRDRRGGHRGGQGRARPPLRADAARGLRNGAQRGRDQRLAGAEAAFDHRAHHPRRSEDSYPRRSDQLG